VVGGAAGVPEAAVVEDFQEEADALVVAAAAEAGALSHLVRNNCWFFYISSSYEKKNYSLSPCWIALPIN